MTPAASTPSADAISPGVALYIGRVLRRLELDAARDGLLLDLGCGDGTTSRVLAQYGGVLASDIERFGRWRNGGGVRGFLQADGAALPLATDAFETVLVKDVLHHAADPDAVLREVRRVVAPGGRVVLLEPNRYNPVFYVHLTLLGEHDHFTRGRFHRMVAGVFPEARHTSFEAHVYPFRRPALLSLAQRLEDAFERVPVARRLLGYNLAVATV